jgi:hypothetical protein
MRYESIEEKDFDLKRPSNKEKENVHEAESRLEYSGLEHTRQSWVVYIVGQYYRVQYYKQLIR